MVYRRKKSIIPKLLILIVAGMLVYEFAYKRTSESMRQLEGLISTATKEPAINLLPQTDNAEQIKEMAQTYSLLEGDENKAVYNALTKIIENYASYPDDYITLAIKNNEAIEFVAGYIDFDKDKAKKIDISNDTVSNGLPLFIQWDKRWGYLDYGESGESIAVGGCGPTCLAMVITGLTGRTDVNPKTVADFAYENRYYVEGVGTSWGLMSEGAKKYGLTVKELSLSETVLKDAVRSGMVIIASMRPGTFTETGHFIILTGVDENGKFIIKDPNSYIRSNQTWDYSVFENEARNFWAFSI